MEKLISDHTPMDDYKMMRGQAVYFIEGVDDVNEYPDEDEKYHGIFIITKRKDKEESSGMKICLEQISSYRL